MLRHLAYSWYTRRLRAQLAGQPGPGHVALIMDGNRRWARQMDLASPSLGHKYGAEHVEDLLRWCEAAGIRHVTVFVCSTENLLRRDADAVEGPGGGYVAGWGSSRERSALSATSRPSTTTRASAGSRSG